MCDKPFRVLLDATDVYLENFKYVWINVSPRELKTISDLKRYILHKINLEGNVQLFLLDGLLLDEETIAVLRENDTLKIKYKIPEINLAQELLKENNFSRKRKRESYANNEDINSKTLKSDIILSSNGNANVVQEKSKNRKKKKQTDSSLNSENPYSAEIDDRKKNAESTNSESFYCTNMKEIKQNSSSMNPENFTCTSVEKGNMEKKSSVSSESFCCISVERKKKTKSSVSLENSSILVEEIQSHKKSYQKKNKRQSPVSSDQTNIFENNTPFYTFNANLDSPKPKNEILSSESALLNPKNKVLNDSSSKDDEFNCHQDESSKVTNEITFNSLHKNQKKRKRKRHRKIKQPLIHEVSDSCEAVDNLNSFSKNDDNIERKHILYLSPDEKQENRFNDANKLHNPSTDTFVLKQEKVALIQSLEYPKMSSPARSKCSGALDLQLSIIPSTNSVIPYNENFAVSHSKSAKSTFKNNGKNKSEKHLYENFKDAIVLPDEGTCIAYKTLELDESYSPSVSDFREGIIEKINPDSEEITIRLNKEIILPGRLGKFENLKEDEVPESIVKTYDVLKWSDVISAKLLSPPK